MTTTDAKMKDLYAVDKKSLLKTQILAVSVFLTIFLVVKASPDLAIFPVAMLLAMNVASDLRNHEVIRKLNERISNLEEKFGK